MRRSFALMLLAALAPSAPAQIVPNALFIERGGRVEMNNSRDTSGGYRPGFGYGNHGYGGFYHPGFGFGGYPYFWQYDLPVGPLSQRSMGRQPGYSGRELVEQADARPLRPLDAIAPPLVAAPATVTLTVPANAEVFLEGARMPGKGQSVRTFRTPELEPGLPYVYSVRVTWTANGEAVERTRDIGLRAGGESRLSFLSDR